VWVIGPEDHQKFTADFSRAGQRSGIGVLTKLAIMDARAVVADRGADIGLERRSKREVPADTETYDTDFPWRDFRMYGKPVQASAAIGIEMRDRSLCSVLLAAGPSGVIEGDHRSRQLDAPINFRRSSNKSVPGQPHASAQQWRSELKNIRVAPYAWILTFGPWAQRRRFASAKPAEKRLRIRW
jgi:hypothetical protein